MTNDPYMIYPSEAKCRECGKMLLADQQWMLPRHPQPLCADCFTIFNSRSLCPVLKKEPIRMQANPDQTTYIGDYHRVEHDEIEECCILPVCLPVDPAPVTEPRNMGICPKCHKAMELSVLPVHDHCADEMLTTPPPPLAPVPTHPEGDPETAMEKRRKNLCKAFPHHLAPVPAIDEPIPTPEQVKRTDRLVMGDEAKPEGTPVERHLTASERRGLSVYEACIHIIERLCAELDALQEAGKDNQHLYRASLDQLRREIEQTHREYDEQKRMTEEQRRRAEFAECFIKSMSQLLGIKKGESFSIALAMLKADLAAAQLREKGSREALGYYAAQGTIGPDEEGRTVTVKCDPSIARAALATKEDK